MMKLMRMEPSRLEQFESSLETKDFDNERKALLSSIIASEKYRNSCEIIPVFDRHGNIVDYEPTETDKKIVDRINEINSGSFNGNRLFPICKYRMIAALSQQIKSVFFKISD